LLLNTPQITVTGFLSEPASSVTVNGLAAPVAGTDFSLSGVPLVEGSNTINVEATDLAGNKSTATVTVNLDTAAPMITITSPVDGLLLNTPQITVAGSLSDPATSVTVNGLVAQVVGIDFSLSGVPLVEGPNTITVEAKDLAGNKSTSTVTVNLDTAAPTVAITQPQNGLFLNTPQITVAGSLSEPASSVAVNGVAAQIWGADFSLSGVPLFEGSNAINVEATDLAGNKSTATVTVNLDTAVPIVTITSPQNGLLLNTHEITVTGFVSEPASVTINGVAAQVIGKNFNLAGVNLTEGQNTIAVTAIDPAGNTGTGNVNITLDATPPAVTLAAPHRPFS